MSDAHMSESLSPVAIEYAQKQVLGRAMTRLRIRRDSKVEAARLAGIVPFSILNFNPVRLKLENLVVNYTVPAYNDKNAIIKTVKVGSVERRAALLVVSNLRGYERVLDAKAEGDINQPVMEYDHEIVHPIEQAAAFEQEYNRLGDPRALGGVLTFKGDFNALKSSNGIIEIPDYKLLPNRTAQFFPKPVSLVERLQAVLDQQKSSTLAKLDVASMWWGEEDPAMRKSVGPMKVWGQFAIDMGWTDQGRLPWMLPEVPDEPCRKCGKMRAAQSAMFCACGAPYDAFAAYMAGHKVEIDYLAALSEDKLSLVKKEMKRRRALFSEEEEETKPTRGK